MMRSGSGDKASTCSAVCTLSMYDTSVPEHACTQTSDTRLAKLIHCIAGNFRGTE